MPVVVWFVMGMQDKMSIQIFPHMQDVVTTCIQATIFFPLGVWLVSKKGIKRKKKNKNTLRLNVIVSTYHHNSNLSLQTAAER